MIIKLSRIYNVALMGIVGLEKRSVVVSCAWIKIVHRVVSLVKRFVFSWEESFHGRYPCLALALQFGV